MREIVKGPRVKLVSLRVSEWCERDVYPTNPHTFLNNTGTVTHTSDLSCEIFVLWDTGAETTFLPHNLELIEEEPKDVYTIALNSLEEVGIKVSRQTLKRVA